MIKIKEVSFSYNNKKNVISKISVNINNGETIGIIGANGAGKSTFLKLLVGLEQVQQGEITIDDIPVEKKNLIAIRQKIGYVFQDADSQLFMPTVYEDVAFAPRNYGLSNEEINTRTMESLQKVRMEEQKDTPIYQLSGGQKKLVSIATALSMKPEILLFDEPTITLDPANRRRFIYTVQNLSGTKIIASHDLDLIYDTCNTVILLAKGEIIKIGQVREILENQKLLEENGLELPLSFSRR